MTCGGRRLFVRRDSGGTSPAAPPLRPPFGEGRERATPLAHGWLPFVEEGQYIFRGEGAGLLKLAALLAVEEFAVAVEHGQRRNTLLHRHLILLHEVLVLVAFADVHVHDFVTFLENGFHVGAAKRQ